MQGDPLNHTTLDPESEASLRQMAELASVRGNRVPCVRTVLVVLSAAGIVIDIEALRRKILVAYPDAAVFFLSTAGKPIGVKAPNEVDLLIDFTGPGQSQGLFLAKKLRRMARVAVGRNAGFFRKRLYDRIFDERDKKKAAVLSSETLERERQVQKEVLTLAGIPLIRSGDPLPDQGRSIALELPPMRRL